MYASVDNLKEDEMIRYSCLRLKYCLLRALGWRQTRTMDTMYADHTRFDCRHAPLHAVRDATPENTRIQSNVLQYTSLAGSLGWRRGQRGALAAGSTIAASAPV